MVTNLAIDEQDAMEYLTQRNFDVPEREAEFLGKEECTCGWIRLSFRATNDDLVYRIIEYCPMCTLRQKVRNVQKRLHGESMED